jgi:hypothetical protein
MRAIPIALAVGALLTGCATVNGPDARLNEGKALADAWASLDAVAKVADNEVHQGVLHGENALRVSDDLKTASRVLQDATAVYKAGRDPTTQITAALAAVADVTTIVGGK